ncbi:MAG: YjbF family lipoprotein [Pseudoxanthomonas sp.]
MGFASTQTTLSRTAAALLAAALLASCSTLGTSSLQALKLAVAGKPDMDPTPGQVAATPYAQILASTTADNRVLMVLGNVDDGLQSWFSSRREIVYLRDGLLVGSHGLEQDAAGIRIEGDNPFARLARINGVVPVQRRYDWMPGYRYGVAVEGRLQRTGIETVSILGAQRQLLHFRESLRGPGVAAENEYWADPETGFIWKSRQLLAPGLSLEIVQLKPFVAGTAP